MVLAQILFIFGLCAVVCLAIPKQTGTNPFTGKTFYVNPSYQSELNTSINSCSGPTCNSTVKNTLIKMQSVASAYWLDVMAKINGNTTKTAEGILADAASKKPVPLVVFIVYDLPNRDCHALASNGEICCYPNADGTCNYNQNGDCRQGLNIYETQYIDPIVKLFVKYQNIVPIVAIIEPDSLPNLATNMGDPHCGNSATQTAYKTGINYAVTQIAQNAPQVTMYVDAAHGGWLGWQNNMQAFVQIIQGLNIIQYIRGFSDNVANYQSIGVKCPSVDYCLNGQHQSDPCCYDPCHLLTQYNPANNEMNYVHEMTAGFQQATGWSPFWVTDTGRDGIANERSDCANWCNIRGAGIGLIPTANSGSSLIDAFYWLKTPGESDGCTQILPNGKQCARYDASCDSADSIGSRAGEPRAPEAGQWFDYQVKMLAANAHMTEEDEIDHF